MATVGSYKPTNDIPPPEQQSPAFKLYHWYFQCLVPANATYDVNDVEYFGIPTTGDRDWDLALATADTDRAFVAADMAVAVSSGSPLTLADPTDAVKLYLIIFEHLCDWRDHLRNSLMNREIPLQGLTEFNQLARLMLSIARRYGYQDGISAKVVKTGRWLENKDTPVSPLGKISHNEAVISEILTLAQQRGYSIKNYSMSLQTEEKVNQKVGSMWSNRR